MSDSNGSADGQLVEHAAQGVDVGGGGGGRADGPFGREVEPGADDLPGGGESGGGVVDEARDAEVAYAHGAVVVAEQIPGFDVPVHDALRVRRRQALAGLLGDLGQAFRRQWSAGGQFTGEAAAVDQFHDQKAAALPGAEVEGAHHVRVVQPCGGLRLHPEAGLRRGVGHIAQQQLDRDRPAEDFVLGPPDLAHPAPPDDRVQPVPIRHQHP